uniref:Uncharacterized protein n=1 Tax=Kalanchoe fedtschenkoi TaxID=63787 RepID=A0A7N0VKA2_KALFE
MPPLPHPSFLSFSHPPPPSPTRTQEKKPKKIHLGFASETLPWEFHQGRRRRKRRIRETSSPIKAKAISTHICTMYDLL